MALIVLGLIAGLILFGVIGGACETLICLHFKRPVRPDPAANPDGLDFGCQGRPGGMPEIKVIKDTDAGDTMFVHNVENGLGRSCTSSSGVSSNSGVSNSSSGSTRYSWQDEKGVTTEMFLDGTLPDAGPGTMAHGAAPVSSIQYQGYQVQGAMRGYEGVHYQGPAAGLASNPPFVLHNEEDDSDYEDVLEDARPSQYSPTQVDFTVAVSTDEIVSPLTPEAQSATLQQQAVSAKQTAGYFADVDLEDGYSHGNHQYHEN